MELPALLVGCSLLLLGCSNASESQHLASAPVQNTNPPLNEAVVVFMGNSITEGWAYHYPSLFKTHPTWVNRGISGQTSGQMLARFDKEVVQLEPDVVVLLAGTNDIAQNQGPVPITETLTNIATMAAHAAEVGSKIILCAVPPALSFHWNPAVIPSSEIKKLNRMLVDLCLEKGYYYLNYHDALVDDRGGMDKAYQSDEVHPDSNGYKVLAPLTIAAIEQVLTGN